MRKAFTLAEVLITLGIIGVVAAMTIPTLMANISAQRYKTQFKKTLSVVNQAVRLNKANYDWDFSNVNKFCNNDESKNTPENEMNLCSIFNANLTGQTRLKLSISDIKEDNPDYLVQPSPWFMGSLPLAGDYSANNDAVQYQLADGSLIVLYYVWFDDYGHYPCSLPAGSSISKALKGDYNNNDLYSPSSCVGFIDVNGLQGPNKVTECHKDNSDDYASTKNDPDHPCIVKGKDVGDIFPIYYYDSTVVPATSASAYALNTTK